MSRHTPKRRARIEELTDELSIGAALRLKCDSDDIHEVVRAVVAYLVDEYPAQELYIPSSVTYPVDEIRADFVRMSMRDLCKKYRIDRRTVYRLLDSEPSVLVG